MNKELTIYQIRFFKCHPHYGTAQRQLDARRRLTRVCLQSHTHFYAGNLKLYAVKSDCHGHALYERPLRATSHAIITRHIMAFALG